MARLPVEITTEVSGAADVDKLADDLDRVGESADKTGAVTTGVFQGIGQEVARVGIDLAKAGIDMAMDAIGDSITLASDKAEAASKVNVLFGESADIVSAASEDAATTVGLSSGKYLDAAGNLGNLITNLGFTGEAAADMTVDMVQLASDMGSFNNASTEEVTEAMGAAFRGETEPIRRFGVMLSEADVKQQAINMGLYDGVGAIDKNAKAQATYQLILKQTTSAQGDFARTSEGYANSQKIASAKIEEALTKVGELILPLAADIIPMLAGAVETAVDVVLMIADGFNNLLTALKPLGDALNVVSDAFDTMTGKINIPAESLHQMNLRFIEMGDTAGLTAEQIDEAWVQVAQAIQEGRVRSDADVAAMIANYKEQAGAADKAKQSFTDMATQAGWSSDQIGGAWAEIQAGMAAGRVRSDADVAAIVANHVEMARSVQREAELSAASAKASSDAQGAIATDQQKISATLQTTAEAAATNMGKFASNIKTKMAEAAETAKNSAVAISNNIVETLRGTPDKIDAIMEDLM